jgi:hypothetical protein
MAAAACSPASPIAPDPGQVNIPGLPATGGDLPGYATPTPLPTRSTRPSAYPTPFPSMAPTPTPTPVVTAPPTTGDGAAGFLATLATKGVVLTDEQLDAVRSCIIVRPSGEWGTKGDLTPEETLAEDFSRYKLRFNPVHKEIKTYQSAAVAFAGAKTGGYYLDLQFFQKFEQPLVAKWEEKSRRFLVITSDGAVSTYTAVASLAPARYIFIPANL